MGRGTRRAVGFDEVTGWQVPYERLRRDPETGLQTVDVDKPNLQKYLRPVPPDGRGRQRATVANNRYDVTVVIGYGAPWPSNEEATPILSVAIGNTPCFEIASATLFEVQVAPLTVTIGNGAWGGGP